MAHALTRYFLPGTSVIVFVFFIITPLQAHETREGVSNIYNLTVGHRSEPVFSREPARFDLIIRDLDNNPYEPSGIDLSVRVLYLKKDSFDEKALKSKELKGDLQRDHNSPNRFNIWYMPMRTGAYGFLIKGTIDGVTIRERFVCGGGSLAGNGFACVTHIQKFPGGWK